MPVYVNPYLVGILGLYGVRQGARAAQDLWRERTLRQRQPVPIREARSGVVLCRGRARRAEGALEAPLSAVPCLAFALQPRQGVPLTSSVPFLLEDDTGRARVEPIRAVLLRPDSIGPEGSIERLLCDGDEVFVLGIAAREPDPAGEGGGYREPPMRLVLRDVPRYGLLVAHGDRPSLVRTAAWNLAKSAAALALAAASTIVMF